MFAFLNLNNLKTNYFNLLLAIFPISFIAGNMIININIVLLILSTIIVFGKNFLNIKYHFLDKIFFLFFFFIIFTAIINDYHFFKENLYWKEIPLGTVIKSLLFLKYLLLYLTLRFLIEKNILKLNLFFIFSTLASLFVCFDLFYQSHYGKDIFGFKPTLPRRLGGPFGDELIAGGFIQRFSLFSFFLIPVFFAEKLGKFFKYIIPLLFIIFLLGIFLSGNRMPLLIFVFTIFLIIIFHKQTRKYFLSFIVLFSIIFYFVFNYNYVVKSNFTVFYNQVSKMTNLIINKDFENKRAPGYLREFVTFYDTWLINKYIGGGIKNFRYYCHVRPNINKDTKFICNMHPHNYYLEILTETGLIGFIILMIIFFQVIFLTFWKKYFTKSSLQSNNIIIPFIFLFIAEIFPLKSTGSFFTTGNATYIFLLVSILVGITRREILIENKT